MPELTLSADDRVLILAPHPDDETIATGGVIQQAVAMGLPLHLVYLTYGDNAETSFIAYRKRLMLRSTSVQGMGLVRHDEAVAAAGILGLSSDQLTFLGYPDFRTLKIWIEHWGDAPACESMFTRTSVVPYANAFRPGTPYKADEILADLETVIRGFQPTVVFTSHPGDHNPDHLALYLFTRVALWNLAQEMQPTLWPALVHHPHWPRPKNYRPDLAMLAPERLASGPAWRTVPLNTPQIETKHRAVQAHKTQLKLDRKLLDSFMRGNELFGDFHVEDLRTPRDPGATTTSQQPVASDQLTHAERLKFVGIEERAVWLDGDRFVVSLSFSRPVVEGVVAWVYLFGYRSDVPFARMPKLRLHHSEIKTALFDQGREITDPDFKVDVTHRRLTFSLPRSSLGDPQWLLASAQTRLADVPLDWVAWRVIALPGR